MSRAETGDRRQETGDRRQETGDRETADLHRHRHLAAVFFVGFVLTCLMSLVSCLSFTEAAVSKSNDRRLEAGAASQGGGTAESPTTHPTLNVRLRTVATVGDAVAGNRVSSSRFRVVPGFLGAALSGTTVTAPLTDLDISAVEAKTDALGAAIAAQTWQTDSTPLFLWDAPGTGLDVAGYSYAVDGEPDNVVDTTSASWDVAQSDAGLLTDGKRIFTVKAINSAGNAGKAASFELWVDTTAPQIASYAPSSGSLLATLNPTVTATVSDAASGVTRASVTLLVNGVTASVTLDEASGTLSSTSGSWKEGTNSVTLTVKDVVGNAQTAQVWSVVLDVTPPAGSVVINGGAEMTTSVYVTLGINGSDATSGLARMLLSNEVLTGYVEEPYVALRELWKLTAVRGLQTVYAKFIDKAGNTSDPVSDSIDVSLLAPETVITSGPAGYTLTRSGAFTFMCPESECLFSYAFDDGEWSPWSAETSATQEALVFGNHYVRVKAAREVNGIEGIQVDEEDPSPAERTWIVGVEPSVLTIPKGPPIKVWRLD